VVTEHWEACWQPGQEPLVVADVAAQSDQVLLAVHQPPRLREMPVPLPGRRSEAIAQARDADQQMLLDQLLTSQPREHTLVIPIIGEPGTGKSHIIKWLRAAIPGRSGLVVRHIPREGTSLPQVVRILLEGLEGGRFDEVRKQMDTAKNDITSLEQAATRLALRIAELIEFGIASGWRRAAKIDDELRQSLCDPAVLPALLTDHACRAHLTREGGPIHRLAADIVDGYRRPAEGDDEELGFRADDLTFSNASAMRGAGAAARRAVLVLQMDGIADAAARILSDALDVAAADVIGLGGVSLTDVFSDLRAELLEQGSELVLLFEDMAIARGLQLDLVDALTTPAVRDGKQLLCNLRVALAITPTYWDEQAPETLATRVSSWGGRMFSLDVPVAETQDVAPTLIGRYLNAARLGIENLEARPASVSTVIANKCDDCPFNRRDECHAIFGATSEGHGFFPLTAAAATTAARLANRETFRPRAVLTEVVGPVIGDRSRLNAGEFPPSDGDIKSLVDGAIQRRVLPDLPLAQFDAIEQAALSTTDRSRLETILRIWDVSSSADPAGLLQALNLPDVASAIAQVAPPPPPPPPPAGPQRPVPPTPTPTPDDERLHAIDQWAGGRIELRADIARVVRRALFDELRAGVRWEEIGFGQEAVFDALGISGPQQQQLNLAVRIKNTAGGGAAGSADPLVVIEPSVAAARLLRGLFLRDKHNSWEFPGGAEALARARLVVRRAETDIAARLAAGPFARKRVTDAAQVLVLASSGLGIAKPTSELLLDGSLVTTDSVEMPLARSRDWLSFAQDVRKAHERSLESVVRAVGRRQGPGARITAFDWSLIDAKRMSRDPAGLRSHPKDEQAHRLHQDLVRAAAAALAAEAEAIGAVVDSIEQHIGVSAPLTLKTIRDAVIETVEIARAAHVLRPPDALGEIDELKLPASTAAAQLLDDARRAVAAAGEGVTVDALLRIARLDFTALKVISRYLEIVDEFVTESLTAAREVIQGNSSGGNGASSRPARDAVRELIEEVEQLIVATNGSVA
jgi:hypothetical protein